MSLVAVNGNTVSRLALTAPAWGLWWAGVDLTEPEALTGAVTLTVAGVSWRGTIASGGVSDGGRAAYMIVGGGGGWGRATRVKSYADDAGVKVSTVLGDAARELGETLASPPATRLGPHFARAADTGSMLLHQLAPRAWYVGADGATHFGARAARAFTGDATIVKRDAAFGTIELAIEDAAGLDPGVTIEGSLPATDIEYTLDGGRLTALVYCASRPSRRLAAWAALVDALDPLRRYRGTWEYRVLSQTGDRLNLQPVRVATGMPELSRVPVRGLFGAKATVVPGALVLVAFADCDPSRPQVIVGDAWGAPGWMPLFLEFGEAPTLGLARQTDPVVAGPFGGTIVQASARIKGGM